jgi:hypothetical protein
LFPTRNEPIESLISPAEISETDCQGQRDQNQNQLYATAAGGFFFIIKQVIDIVRAVAGIRANVEPGAFTSRCRPV